MVDPVGQYSRPDIFCLHIDKSDNPHTIVTGERSADSAVDRANPAFERDDTIHTERSNESWQEDLLKISPDHWK